MIWSGVTRKGLRKAKERIASEIPMAKTNLAEEGEIRGPFRLLKNRKQTDVTGERWFNPKISVKPGHALVDFIENMKNKQIVQTEAVNTKFKICPIEQTLDSIPDQQVGRYIW